MDLKKATVVIDYVVCKSNGIDSETLGHYIQAHGRTAGYEVMIDGAGSGGSHNTRS